VITADRPNAVIGQDVVDHVNRGSMDDTPLWDKHWHDDFMSVEVTGDVFERRPKETEKCEDWISKTPVHACRTTGPYVTPNGFCVRYELDFEPKDGSFPRMQVDEIGVYTVTDGKIVREEFFSPPMPY